MYVYIDALFKPREGCPLPPHMKEEGLLTTDSLTIRDIPPFLLAPERVILASGDGNVEVFDDPETEILLGNLGERLENPSSTETLVGWYTDQVLYPVLAANAMLEGVRVTSGIMRKLDDKWSKPFGFSVERAFYQGWYPERKDLPFMDYTSMTLDKALRMTKLPSISEVAQGLGDGLMEETKLLVARVSSISQLFTRYQHILTNM